MTRRLRTDWKDLAVFGNEPAFAEPLHVGRPNIGDRAKLLERLNDMLDRRWLTNHGKYEREFESRLREITGVRHCIPICNGTSALEIAIKVSGLEGEVIVPAFTFVATPHAVAWQGMTPVFADVDPKTHTIDPASVERLITEKTTGIVGVHLWGQPCDIDALEQLARQRGLKLLFDAAQAFGCSHKGRPIGNFGDLEVFSFHATKFVNSFEGGAIATNDDALADRIRLMINFGLAGPEQVEMLGTNRKMSEPSAAMGITSLESMHRFLQANRANFQAYRTQLKGIRGIELYENDPTESNCQYIVMTVDENRSGLDRDALCAILHAENILARRHFHPGCHRMEPYKSWFSSEPPALPVTDRLANQVLCLPTGTAVNSDDIELVCSVIKTAVGSARDVTRRLAPLVLAVGT